MQVMHAVKGTEAAIDHRQKVKSQKFAMHTVGWGIN